MLEILQFYVSDFWVWAGITLGLWFVCMATVMAVTIITKGLSGRS